MRDNAPGRSGELLTALLLATPVFNGATFGLAQGIVISLFVKPKRGLHSGFLVKDFPDRGRLVPAVFLIGERLESAVQSQRKGNRNGRGFLVSHAGDRVIPNMTGQENSIDRVYDTIIHIIHAQNEAAQRQRAGDVPARAKGSTTPDR